MKLKIFNYSREFSKIDILLLSGFGATFSAFSICVFYHMRNFQSVERYYIDSNTSMALDLFQKPQYLYFLLLIPLLMFVYYICIVSGTNFSVSSAAVSLIFTINIIISLSMEHSDLRNINLPFSVNFTGLLCHFAVLVGFFLLCFFGINFFYSVLDYKCFTKKIESNSSNSWHLFSIAFIALAFCWTPVLYYCYPGSIVKDTLSQIKQYCGVVQFDVSHPILATLIYGLLFAFGRQIANESVGLFLAIAMQTLFNCVVMSLVAVYVRKYTRSNLLYLLTILFYGVCPIWAKASQLLLKDILHTGCFLLFYLHFLVCLKEDKSDISSVVLMFVLALLITFTRKAVFWLAIICIVILIFSRIKSYWLKYGICAISLIVFFFFCNDILYPSLGFREERESENYSLQTQQIALYCRTFYNEISDEEKEIINGTLNFDTIVEEYTPMISDKVKGTYHGNSEAHEAFWNLYQKFFFRHPWIFIKAVLMGSFEHFNPWYGADRTGKVYIYKDPEFHHITYRRPTVWKLNAYWQSWYNIPILRLFISAGIFSWVLIAIVGYSVHRRSLQAFWGTVPSLVLTIGLLFSHVNGEIRYAYPMIAATPLVLSFAIYSISAQKTSIISHTLPEYMQVLQSIPHFDGYSFLFKIRTVLQPYSRLVSNTAVPKRTKEKMSEMIENRQGLIVYNRFGDILLLDFLATLCKNGGNADVHTFGKIHYSDLSKYAKLWQGLPFEEELEAVLSWIKLDRVSEVFSICMKRIQDREKRFSPERLIKKPAHRVPADGIAHAQLIDLRGDLLALGQQRIFAGTLQRADFCHLLRCLALERGILQIDAFDYAYQAMDELSARGVSYAIHIPNTQQELRQHIADLFERTTTQETLQKLKRVGQFAVDCHTFSDFSTITSCWQTDIRNSILIKDEIITDALASFHCEGISVICYMKKDNATGISSKLYEYYLYSSRSIQAYELLSLYHRGCTLIGQYNWSILCDSSQEPSDSWQAYSQMVSSGVKNCCERLLQEDRSSQVSIEQKQRECEKSIQYALRIIKHAKLNQS